LSISFVDNKQRQFCFLNFVVLFLFPWLAGRFYNFELMQNRKKARNGSTGIYFLKLNNVSVFWQMFAD
jgi:hypothetical protein